MENRICKRCGKQVSKKNTNGYCSQLCKSIDIGTRIEYNCDFCGKITTDKKSHYFKKKNHYCSDECKNNHQSVIYRGESHPGYNSETKKCDFCGEDVAIPKHRIDNKLNFCNKECYSKYIEVKHVVFFNCDFCNKPTKCSKSSYENKQHHYCSKKCANKHHGTLTKGENNINYNKVNALCEICGTEVLKAPSYLKRNNHVYCSKVCKVKGNTLFYSGKNNSRWKEKVDYKCDYCGRENSMQQRQYENFEKHYCSKKCQIADYKNPLRPLYEYLRTNCIWEWYHWSEEVNNYKCAVTGSKKYIVHHVYKFEYIIKDIFDSLGF